MAQLVPWVWGINGSTSVLGSVLAISIAINLGFRVTLVCGLLVYGIAYLTAGYIAGGERKASPIEALRQSAPSAAASRRTA